MRYLLVFSHFFCYMQLLSLGLLLYAIISERVTFTGDIDIFANNLNQELFC